MLRADAEHLRLLQEDLQWVHAWTWSTTGLPSPGLEWPAWRALIQASPGKFKGITKRARALDVLRHCVIAALHGLYKALTGICGSAGDDPSTHHPGPLTEVCIPCRRAFRDRRSWSSHAARKHGYRSHAFLCAQDSVCRACGKCFASVGRLKRHLLSRQACVQAWGQFQPSMTELAGRSLQPIHPLSVPVGVPGHLVDGPQSHIRLDVSTTLLDQLQDLDPADESAAWNLVESFIEPLKSSGLLSESGEIRHHPVS